MGPFLKYAVSLFMFTATFSSLAGADENDPSILSEFGNYRLTDVGAGKIDELYADLSSDLSINQNGLCYERAHLWGYQLYKQHQIQSGKIFLFYAWWSNPNKPWAYRDAQGWWFHVVPYVVANGKEYVLEKFGEITVPMPFDEWERRRANGNKCVPISSNSETDRNNFFRPLTNPNYAMSFNNDLGPCFIRRTPMYYKTTTSVGEQGLLGNFEYQAFSTDDVYNSCLNVIPGRDRSRSKKCGKFIDSGSSADISR